MGKLPDEQRTRITAGLDLICEETTTLDKIQKISTLLKGLNPKIDQHLENISNAAKKIQQIQSGKVIDLAVEKLPEETKEQKERKKWLLFLWNNWNDLKSEVERINNLQNTSPSGQENLTGVAKILSTMKGPLGLVTVAAAGIVAVAGLINSKTVIVNVKNDGCQPIGPFTETTINLPGLKLPNKAIIGGGQEAFVVPGINILVDVGQDKNISFSALSLSGDYRLPAGTKDILYDGQSLMGKVTKIKLSGAKLHNVIVKCNP